MGDKRKRIFISSVQKELQQERRHIKDYVQGDALLKRYFDVFLFEDIPASDRSTDGLYLEQVERCDVYVGLLGSEYGHEDFEGLSPTEREFDHATAKSKTRITNTEYQRITGTIKKTASRDLDNLVSKSIFQKIGITGRGTYYVLAPKGDIKGT